MSSRFRVAGGVLLALHLTFVVVVSLQDALSALRNGRSLLSRTPNSVVQRATTALSTLSRQPPSQRRSLRVFLSAYFQCSGVENGYSFFAPSVPGNAKLVFELRYPDGHAEYDVPVVSGVGGGDRISALIDQLRFVHYVRLREALLRSLVDGIHREHPSAITVRAVLGDAKLTTPAEYRAGNRISYQPLFAYDFHYDKRTKPAPSP